MSMRIAFLDITYKLKNKFLMNIVNITWTYYEHYVNIYEHFINFYAWYANCKTSHITQSFSPTHFLAKTFLCIL